MEARRDRDTLPSAPEASCSPADKGTKEYYQQNEQKSANPPNKNFHHMVLQDMQIRQARKQDKTVAYE